MKKIFATIVAAVSLLAASCSKDDPLTGGNDAGIYRITIEVSGTDAKGFAHIINLDKVNIKNEGTGVEGVSKYIPSFFYDNTPTFPSRGVVIT